MFLVTLSSTEFTARELCQQCDVLASEKPEMLFFSAATVTVFGLARLMSQLSVLFTWGLKCSSPHPFSPSPASAFMGIKLFSFSAFLLGLHQRRSRRLCHDCL